MDIVKQIQQRRDKIKDIRANYKWLQDGKIIGTFQWGWKQGKEFLISPDHHPDCLLRHDSFDGQKSYSLGQHKVPVEIKQLNRSFEYTGSISTMLEPPLFTILSTPQKLMGDYLMDAASFPECLEKAESLTIRSETEEINGASCIVVEARKLLIGGQILRSLLIWVDPNRDYLPVKIESYEHQNIHTPDKSTDTPYENGCLSFRQDNIILGQVDGFWFPISGNSQAYRMEAYLPDGRCLNNLTQEEARELEKTMTEEEFLKQAVFRNEPSHNMRLEVSDIKINQGINDDEFRVQFPAGCAVSDAFKNQYYVLGEASEKEMSYSSDDWLEQVKNLSFDQLIDILKDFRLGVNTQKVFAAIKTIVERKPSYLPQMCDLLRTTDNTNLQRFLSLILREIGSKEAVPALIDALANCGESSDCGLGVVITPLDRYYHNLQIDPTDNDLGLARPVREITFALEKITGHTEGQEHFNFYFYDENGECLKSVQMTDELKERIHERNRQVAQQWRDWLNR